MLRFFPPDDAVFRTSKLDRETPSEEEQGKRLARLTALEEVLRVAVGGCPLTGDCFRRYLLGELSYKGLGEELRVSKATAWRMVQEWMAAVRSQTATALALDCFVKGDGFTIDVRRGGYGPAAGYGVSLGGTGQVFHWLPTEVQVREYLLASAGAFNSSKPPKIYFGGWIKNGFHLEHTVIIREELKALRVAKAEGQRSVYDFRKRCDLPVPDDRREAA